MKLYRSILALLLSLLLCLATAGVGLADDDDDQGRTYAVTITNLTKKQVLTPPLVISHTGSFQLFSIGEAASDSLAALAEGGDLQPFMAMLGTRDDVHDYMAGGGPILPGASMTIMVQVKGKYRLLSVASMLASTNDAFAALSGVRVTGGAMHFMVGAYDAGSEKNTELCSDVPGPPCSAESGNNRVTEGAEGFVHVHNGIHGVGDLNAANMDWHNPVASVLIKKMK